MNTLYSTIKSKLRPKTRLRNLVRRLQIISYTRGVGLTRDHREFLKLKNLHQGQRAILIGNGPSLRVSDLKKLEGETCFAANKIYLAFDEIKWRPSYYFVEDRLVLQQNLPQIKALNCCPKFFPEFALEWADRIPGGNYYKYDWGGPEGSENPCFGFSPVTGFYWGGTVMYIMLQLANYMGFSKVYLIGVDFDFTIPKAPPKGIELTSEGEQNHFHKDYRKPGEKWNVPSLDVQLKSFSRAREFSASQGWKIFNATRGGKLEVFERVDFDSLF